MRCPTTNEEKIKRLETKIAELTNVLKLEHENMLNKPKKIKEGKTVLEEKYKLPIHPKIVKEKIEKNEVEMKKLVSTLKYHPSDFVIAIVAANRPQYLKKLFESLQRVEYWNKKNTILFQYGDSEPINNLVEQLGIRQVKNPVIYEFNNIRLTEGAQHIALHYRFTLTKIFRELYPQAEHVIIIEDDMILAPDFLLYFSQVAPYLHNDPTVYAASAYNDNGFVDHVKHDNLVLKTDFFIGLGWLVSAKHFKNEWEKIWPMNHWDHFFRSPINRKDRKTIYPEVSRVFHAGFKGTHSDVGMYEKYFRNIKLNLNSYSPLGISPKKNKIQIPKNQKHSLNYLMKYDLFMKNQIKRGKKITRLKEILQFRNQNILIYYEEGKPINNNWNYISNYFKIWHSIPIRSEYEGVVTLRWAGNWLFLIKNTSPKFYKGEPMIDMKEFATSIPLWERNDKKSNLKVFKGAMSGGESCNQICKKSSPGSLCNVQHTANQLNNCIALSKHFDCKKCEGSMGSDQPAFVYEDGRCLFNLPSGHHQTSCQASHGETVRLCACYNPNDVIKQIEKEWDDLIYPK
eukprot:gene7254-11572_t